MDFSAATFINQERSNPTRYPRLIFIHTQSIKELGYLTSPLLLQKESTISLIECTKTLPPSPPSLHLWMGVGDREGGLLPLSSPFECLGAAYVQLILRFRLRRGTLYVLDLGSYIIIKLS
jgi:hypothetical protein